ncbi:NrsF family protein [Rhizobium sp. RAF56]|uniref:NrsF family protein n=1 Tax=Rhizobium sp. RAF56 TaxID=3233062 RepID=UPI003F9861A1
MTTTDDLVERLARDLRPLPRHALAKTFLIGVLSALVVSLGLMLVLVGPRPDMALAMQQAAFWIKSAYNLLLAIAAYFAMYRLARPEGTQGRFFFVAAAIVAVMIVAAIVQLAASAAYRPMLLGHSALRCPFLIIGFALPVFVGNLWVLRKAAPTDLKLAGLVSGLAAGAGGAWVYSWFCTESGMPFVLIWYSLGIILCGLFGRWVGPRLLRW